jgi:hypothetical protein
MFQSTNQDMLTELKVFLQETIVLTKKIKKPPGPCESGEKKVTHQLFIKNF